MKNSEQNFLKTGQEQAELSRLMDEETYFHAKKAVEYGFADKIIGDENPPTMELSSRRQIMNCMTNAIKTKLKAEKKSDNRVDAAQLYKRLNLLS